MSRNQSIDVFANTNQVLIATVLGAFARGFVDEVGRGAEVPLLYVAAPIAMSGSIAATFDGTNRNTSLLTWIHRNPQLRAIAPELLSATAPYVRRAINFGMLCSILRIDDQGLVLPGTVGIERSALAFSASDIRGSYARRAQRFGAWCGRVASLETTFTVMGIVT